MRNYKEMVGKIGKDKLLLLALAGGLLLFCSVPSGDEKQEKQTQTLSGTQAVSLKKDDMEEYVEKLESRLEELIGEIEGVEQVHVMITLKSGASKEILKDESVNSEDTSESDSEGGQRSISSYGKDESTVYIRDSSGQEVPYVLSEISPEVEGVAVVADGGDSPVIKEKIISLIKALFGIEINKIMVTV